MFNQKNGDLLLLTDVMSGNPVQYQLPMLPGYNTYSRSVAISHDWHTWPILRPTQISARRRWRSRPEHGRCIPHLDRARHRIDQLGLQRDRGQLQRDEYGVCLWLRIKNESWEVRVINLTDPNPTASGPVLRSSDPAVQALKIGAQYTGPVVRLYQGGEVTFTIIHLATEGAPKYDSYLWNTSTHQVRKVENYPSLDTDTYWPPPKPSRPRWTRPSRSAAKLRPVLAPEHAVRLRSDQPEQLPVLRHAARGAVLPTFVQNGQRILVGGNASDSNIVWDLIERSGARVGRLPSGAAIESVIGWQDGSSICRRS